MNIQQQSKEYRSGDYVLEYRNKCNRVVKKYQYSKKAFEGNMIQLRHPNKINSDCGQRFVVFVTLSNNPEKSVWKNSGAITDIDLID